MEKVLEYTLRQEDLESTAEGLVNLILKNCLRVTGHEISRAKYTPDGITVDGKQTRVSERMLPGQTLRVRLPEDPAKDGKMVPQFGDLPGGGPLEVLYEDDDVLLVNKPAGIVVHPSPGHYRDTMANYIAGYFQEKGEQTACRIIGRLDKETSGVLLYAKNRAAAARLTRGRARQSEETSKDLSGEQKTSNGLSGRQKPHDGRSGAKPLSAYERTYFALAEGFIPEENGIVENRMDSIPDVLLKRQITEDGSGMPARTAYQVLQRSESATLLKLHIDTGRTHQIRLQMAGIGHPLVGDTIYGSDAPDIQGEDAERGHYVSMPDRPTPPETADGIRENAVTAGPRAMLHAGILEFDQPFSGERIRITAGFPEDFLQKCLYYGLSADGIL